ncbi:hypothetical protein KIL84_009166 [Mauremys mutica]|uniref:Uncharacterized protein n=1 Tax=Mauremys mutica TaxID=74926 RepID=A0A9D4B4W2_9SAUR|nr:hypothetical protein KIL84_009166 [Mauremys mutica]
MACSVFYIRPCKADFLLTVGSSSRTRIPRHYGNRMSINKKCLVVSEGVVAMNTAGLWRGKRNTNVNGNVHLFQANFKPASVIYRGNAQQLSDSVPRKALAHGYKFSLQRTEKSGAF